MVRVIGIILNNHNLIFDSLIKNISMEVARFINKIISMKAARFIYRNISNEDSKIHD
jgi:hypothetical protein